MDINDPLNGFLTGARKIIFKQLKLFGQLKEIHSNIHCISMCLKRRLPSPRLHEILQHTHTHTPESIIVSVLCACACMRGLSSFYWFNSPGSWSMEEMKLFCSSWYEWPFVCGRILCICLSMFVAVNWGRRRKEYFKSRKSSVDMFGSLNRN
jgi:hypothetical protein